MFHDRIIAQRYVQRFVSCFQAAVAQDVIHAEVEKLRNSLLKVQLSIRSHDILLADEVSQLSESY